MKEILILSGKGGTGKTTLAGALAVLMSNAVLADCDVDAPDLHLLLSPAVKKEHEFRSGYKAKIDPARCSACGTCAELCRFDAVTLWEARGPSAAIDSFSCEGCGVCVYFCPEEAITLKENLSGSWCISDTPCGPMVHAQLGIGEENSGKLVSLVKREARVLAEKLGKEWILVDGPPGIGCPVISSLSGADFVLLITEPSRSGLHDLRRVTELVSHFKLPAGVCINKWDLNREHSDKIRSACTGLGVPVVGQIPFDRKVIQSLVSGKPLDACNDGPAARAVGRIWEKLKEIIR